MSFYPATFRIGLPTNKQIHPLNQNAIVSLSNDDITREKVETCITNNPSTILLAPTNATVDIINNHVLDVLLESHIPLTVVTNGLQSQMPLYRNMTVIITENRYVTSFDVYITHFFKIFELFTCHRETTCNTISTLRDGYYLHIIDPNFSY